MTTEALSNLKSDEESANAVVVNVGEMKSGSLHADTQRDAEADNMVDWDGPDDPENPLNWPAHKSFGHVILVSVLSFITNLCATEFAPAVRYMAIEFSVTNRAVAALSVSLYLAGFALGPLVLAPLSEIFGRLPVYHGGNVAFVAFVVGTALSQNVGQLLTFRLLSGLAGAVPLTVGGATIADCIRVEKRGGATAIFGLGPVVGPTIGPVIGGFLGEAKGWRWTFWLVAIMGGVATVATFIFMKETNPATILKRKTIRLRKTTGNASLQNKLNHGQTHSEIITRSLIRPMQLLIFSPVVLVTSVYVAFIFGLLYLLYTTVSPVFQGQYGFGTGISGLAYIGLVLGNLVGLVIFGLTSDRIQNYLVIRHGDAAPKPEYRLPLMIYFPPLIVAGLLIYGWTAQNLVHWIVPIIGISFVGFGSFFVIVPSQIYLVDLFGSEAAASALAANVLLRCLFGAFLPLAGPYMYESLKYGWGNTLLALLALLFMPAPQLFYMFGERLRKHAVKM